MRAHVGDLLRVRGHHVGDPDRCAEVVEIRGPEGTPPYVVRWDATSQPVLFFPGSDCTVEHSKGEEVMQ